MARRIREVPSAILAAGPVLAISLILACAGVPAPCLRGSEEPPPQVVLATEIEEEAMASCGGAAFPATVVEEPVGPADQLPPEFNNLNEILSDFRVEFRLPDDTIWRLAVRDEGGATFLTHQDGVWIYAIVTAGGNGWRASGMGQCGLHGVVSTERGAAQWWLDDRVPSPMSDSIELPVLVQDTGCSSGCYATGRIRSPRVRYTADSVVIFAAVSEIGGNCLLSPATPAVFILPEPIGDRQLLDGFHVPPAPPRPFQ
jgi:hypothetical protein